MNVAVQPLALGLKAFEDALGDGRDLVLGVAALRLGPGPAEVCGARLDVADRELELLQPSERAPAGLVR